MTAATFNADTEQALLGAILINPGILATLPTTADHFHIDRHKAVFQAMQALYSGGTAIDNITLSDKLEKMGQLKRIGGPAFLVQLLTTSGVSYHAEDYAEQLAELAERRVMMQVLSASAGRVANGEAPAEIAADMIAGLSTVGARSKGAKQIADHHFATKAEIDRRANQIEMDFALDYGYKELNRILGRTYPDEGTQILLTGEPAMGKTILMADITRNWSHQSPGVIYSAEMSAFRFMLRDLSVRTGELVSQMKRGKVDMEKLNELDEYYAKRNIYLSDESNWTTASLRADLTRLKYQANIRWYAFDYLSLIGDRVDGKEYDRVREISRRLLLINRRLGLASIIIHTLSKEGSVSGAAGVQYDADIILKLRKPYESEKVPATAWKQVMVEIVKNRDGEGIEEDTTLGLQKDRPHFVDVMI